MPGTEKRARNFLFTISVAGEGNEHKLLGISNIRQVIEAFTHNESTRIDTISLAGHLNVDNITVREAPFMGCIGEAAPNFVFEVAVDGTTVARCRRISGLGVRWEVIENRESNKITTQKLWGHRSYPEITHDVVIDWQDGWVLYNYLKKVAEVVGPGDQFAEAQANCPYTVDVTITAKRQDGKNVAKWTLHRAWPTNWTPISDLAADANDVGLETITWVVAPVPGAQGITEDMTTYFSSEHLVSTQWYDFVSKAFDLPEKKDLIISIYHPGAQPGKDKPVGKLKLFNAWPSEITYGDLNASDNAVLTRDITITFEGIRVI